MKKILTVLALLLAMPFALSGTVDVDMDVNSGSVDIITDGVDSSSWHPGSIGETNEFHGVGGFSGNYYSTEGNYGRLNSYINVDSKTGGADFVMLDTQDFNVLSANHINNVVGNFYAHTSGNDDRVAMNLKSVGSMYVWSEATNPWSATSLRGGWIEKEIWTTQNSVLKTNLYLEVITSGEATMSNSNIWGWSNGETGTSTTNYGGGTRTVTSTGTGVYTQSGYVANNLNFNGFNFGAGNAILTGNFNGGMSGTYTMDAN